MRESSAALAAFTDYQRQTPPRSLDRLAQSYQTCTDPAPPTRQLTTLKVWSRAHAWQERVAAHDRAVAAETEATLRAEQVAEAKRRRDRRLKKADLMDQIVVLRLGQMIQQGQLTERLSPVSMVAMAQHADRTERLDMGEAESRTEITGKDGGPITVIEVMPLPRRAPSSEEEEADSNER